MHPADKPWKGHLFAPQGSKFPYARVRIPYPQGQKSLPPGSEFPYIRLKILLTEAQKPASLR